MLPTHLVEMQKYLLKQSIEFGSFPDENKYMLNLWLHLYIIIYISILFEYNCFNIPFWVIKGRIIC